MMQDVCNGLEGKVDAGNEISEIIIHPFRHHKWIEVDGQIYIDPRFIAEFKEMHGA